MPDRHMIRRLFPGRLPRARSVIEMRAGGRQAERRNHGNNFDAIRLIAALTVIAGHAVPLTGRGDPPTVAGVPFFDIAVYVFFSVSGFLIAQSWARSPRVGRFLARRVARIFPALVVVVLISMFILGPLLTVVNTAVYFGASETWGYLSNLLLFATYRLPGVFEDNPLTTVNGSLWTLGPEFVSYLLLLGLGLLASRLPLRGSSRGILYASFALALAAADLFLITDPRAPVSAMVFFFVAAALGELVPEPSRIPLVLAVVLVAVWVGIGTVFPSSSTVLAWCALPIAVIAVGTRSFPGVQSVGRPGDASYGVYLWGFPVQQTLYSLAPRLPLILSILIAGALCYVIGLASWHTIEQRALLLARRFGRRGDGVRTTRGDPGYATGTASS